MKNSKHIRFQTFVILMLLAIMASSVTPIVADHGDVPSQTTTQDAAVGDLDFFLNPNDNSGVIVGRSVQTRLGAATTTANPDLDPSFGVNGKVTLPASPRDALYRYDERISALAIQPDGKQIAFGNQRIIDNQGSIQGKHYLINRYHTNGAIDTSFGTGGRVTGQSFDLEDGLVQTDGKIVVVGEEGSVSGGFIYLAVYRFNSNGTPDNSFGFGGRVSIYLKHFNFAHSVVIQPDGKIVVAGMTADGLSSNFGDGDFFVVRFNTNGSRDDGSFNDSTPLDSFGTAGAAVTDFAGKRDEIAHCALQSDGKIVVVGTTLSSDGNEQDYGLARYNPTGFLDLTFGTAGKTTISFTSGIFVLGDSPTSIAVQSDGKIVVGGFPDISLARFSPAGILDSTFGTGGKVTIDSSLQARAGQLTIRPDGKIFVAGSRFVQSTGSDFLLALFNQNGTPDTTFGTGGYVATDFGTQYEGAGPIILQPDGNIIIGGSYNPTGDTIDGDFAMARYLIQNTATGSSVTVQTTDASATFPTVTQAGNTTFAPITPGSAGTLPIGYTLCPTCPAYDITTTAAYTPPVTVCLGVPASIDQPTFSRLTLLHGEGGVLVDRTTGRFTDGNGNRTVCGSVSSLSPFVLAQAPAAAPATVDGRVLTSDGRGLRNATVSITDSNNVIRRATTSSFGFFSFDNIATGQTYTVRISSRLFRYSPQTVQVNGNLTLPDFVGLE